jgi:hypothetical protein
MDNNKKNIIRIISFDPGTVHFGLCIFDVIDGEITKIITTATVNVDSPNKSPDPIKLMDLMELMVIPIINTDETILYVIEYQPPLNTLSNPGLVRKNTWVEAFLDTWARLHHIIPTYVYPASVKKYWNFPKLTDNRQYKSNKTVSKELAQEKCRGLDMVLDDHVSDCILNGLFLVNKDR